MQRQDEHTRPLENHGKQGNTNENAGGPTQMERIKPKKCRPPRFAVHPSSPPGGFVVSNFLEAFVECGIFEGMVHADKEPGTSKQLEYSRVKMCAETPTLMCPRRRKFCC